MTDKDTGADLNEAERLTAEELAELQMERLLLTRTAQERTSVLRRLRRRFSSSHRTDRRWAVDTTGDEPQTAASIRAARATVADGSSLPPMAAPQERLVAAVSLVLYGAAVARHSVPRGFRRAETGYSSHPARPPNGRA
jgi:hypothetical protein